MPAERVAAEGGGGGAAGNVRVLRADVFLGADGAGPGLASTGFTPLPFVVSGLAAFAAGAGLLVAARRRSNWQGLQATGPAPHLGGGAGHRLLVRAP